MFTTQLDLLPFNQEAAHQLEQILNATNFSEAGWHYCLDYQYVLKHFDPERHHKILDVGCGPHGNALHQYLEVEYGKDVKGLDRLARVNPVKKMLKSLLGRNQHAHIDFDQDLLAFEESGWDLIIAVSSLEHNTPEVSMRCWQQAQKLLAPGGLLVATFAIAGDDQTKWNPETRATDLSLADVAKYWQTHGEADMEAIRESYQTDYLRARHGERFGAEADFPLYFAAGTTKGSEG